MKFKIPFTLAETKQQQKRSSFLLPLISHKPNSKLNQYLENSDTKLTREEYLSICLRNFIFNLILIFFISTTILVLMKINKAILISLGLTFVFSLFLFFSQSIYPKIYSSRKIKDIEKNLIPALEDISIQLNSGIPLFSILINISESNYGELSNEMKKAVKQINAGLPEAEVLENLGEKNPSIYFRRILWQLSNGMKAGSDMNIIIKGSIKSLNEEQLIQIQNYGNKLNPLIMFYMLISVILPALSITFLTVISSLVNLPESMTKMLYIGLFIFVVLIQIMFLGVIKSARPSLL